jgi:hypothetical protein
MARTYGDGKKSLPSKAFQHNDPKGDVIPWSASSGNCRSSVSEGVGGYFGGLSLLTTRGLAGVAPSVNRLRARASAGRAWLGSSYRELLGPPLWSRHLTGILRALDRAGRETKTRGIAGWLVRSSPHADCLYCRRSV